jgi:hypothetical protein
VTTADTSDLHGVFRALITQRLAGEHVPHHIMQANVDQVTEIAKHAVMVISVLAEETPREVCDAFLANCPDDEAWEEEWLPFLRHQADQMVAAAKEWKLRQEKEAGDE